jgi:hypothetical protein
MEQYRDSVHHRNIMYLRDDGNQILLVAATYGLSN